MSQLSITKADENILKTALAFVVLRQRVKKNNAATSNGRITSSSRSKVIGGTRSSAEEQSSHEFNSDNVTQSQCQSLHSNQDQGSGVISSGSGSSSSSNRLKRKYPGQDYDSQDNIDNDYDPGPLPFLRRINLSALSDRNSARGASLAQPLTESAAKRRHISTMFRIALSTAHPLYLPFISSLKSIQEDGTRMDDADSDAGSDTNVIPSTVYDCKTASWTREEMESEMLSFSPQPQAPSSPSIATYSVLDGILAQLVSDLNSFVAYQNHLDIHVRALEMEQGQYQDSSLSNHNKDDSGNGIVYSLFIAPLMEKLFHVGDGNMDENKRVQMILTMCTILQRVVFLGSSLSSSLSSSSNLVDDVMVGICGVFKALYYHDFPPIPLPIDVEGQETHGFGKIMVQLPDILAVNCLVLLEEIVSLKLSKAAAVCNSSFEQQECIYDCDSDDYHEISASALSEAAGDILNVLNVALGELILPIPVQEMAAFCISDMEQRDNLVRSEIEYSGLLNRVGNLDVPVEFLNRGLNTGAKMMLRMSLFDLIQKLSSSHMDDIHF